MTDPSTPAKAAAPRPRRPVAPLVLLILAALIWATWLGFRLFAGPEDISLLTATTFDAGENTDTRMLLAAGYVASYFAAVLLAPIFALAAAMLWAAGRLFRAEPREADSTESPS